MYRAWLTVQDDQELPFIFEVKNDSSFVIYNAEEEIIVDEITYINDSIKIQTPVFEGYIIAKISNNELIGSFIKESYDRIILLNHHSILDTDSDPLFNSRIVVDFVRENNIEHAFCGHTHQLSIMRSTDLYHKHSFTQYKNGSLSSTNTPNDTNMFLYYKNFGTEAMDIHIVRAIVENGCLKFKEEVLPATRTQ